MTKKEYWLPCQKYCIGQCPCPEPPWLWKMNITSNLLNPKRDPQRKFTPGYLRSLPMYIWDGETV